jgi:hypothetical protein
MSLGHYPEWSRRRIAVSKKKMSQVLHRFGEERRRVVSAWRIAAAVRRTSPDSSDAEVNNQIQRCIRAGELTAIDGLSGIYTIELPFADLLPVADHHVLQEANPFAVFSHGTAMVWNGLTDQPAGRLYVTDFGRPLGRIPLGTKPEDWAEQPLPPRRFPDSVRSVDVIWTRASSKFEYGVTIDQSQNVPCWMTNIERTLIDCLRDPSKAGGFSVVAQAWRNQLDTLKLDDLLNYAARFNSPIMRQRTGFVLEAMGIRHKRLDEWAANAKRGGSMVLVPGSPFDGKFSSRWCLALNASESSLELLAD